MSTQFIIQKNLPQQYWKWTVVLNFQNEPSSSSIRNSKRTEYTLQSKVTSYGWSLLMDVSIDKKKAPRSRFHFFIYSKGNIF